MEKETRRAGEGKGEYRLRAGMSLMLPKEKIRRKVICGRSSAQRVCCEVIAQSL